MRKFRLVNVLAHRSEHDQQHVSRGRVLADGMGDLKAIHAGHLHIQDRQVVGPAGPGSLAQHFERRGRLGNGGQLQAPTGELLAENLEVRRIVVECQDAQLAQVGRNLTDVGRGAGLLGERHRTPERGTTAKLAVDTDLACHQLDQRFGNGQAESRAAVLARRGHVDLRKRAKQPATSVLGNANAGVGDAQPHDRGIGRFAFERDAHHDFAGVGELDRVVD